MYQLIFGTITISVLHALIPSHWLPLISLAKSQNWTAKETLRFSFYLSLAHIFSTILLGGVLGGLVFGFKVMYQNDISWIGPVILILSGIYFMYRHHTHHHFHIDDQMMDQTKTKKQILYALLAFMFLSPCLEIEAFFINASIFGWWMLIVCVLIYIIVSLIGMVSWVMLAFRGLKMLNSHTWEHNAGIITGGTMVLTGLISLLFEVY